MKLPRNFILLEPRQNSYELNDIIITIIISAAGLKACKYKTFSAKEIEHLNTFVNTIVISV